MELSVNQYLEQSIKNNWDREALADINGASIKFSTLAEEVAKLHILFEHVGIQAGDKVALCGKNSMRWSVAFIGIITYGAIPVPLLNEFKSDNIHYLVTHSDSKLLFADQQIWDNLDITNMPRLLGVALISDFSVLASRSSNFTHACGNINKMFGERYPQKFSASHVVYSHPGADDLALINYTSGSTGSPKGVMVPHRALSSNILYTIEHLTFLKPGDGMVCMLPLAHMYGLVVEMLHPIVKGCHVHFITRVPSPKVILGAFAEVKPKLIVTVPLVLEKIIKTKVLPKLETPTMRFMLKLPIVSTQIFKKIKAQLVEAFGGNLVQVIIGGAALNAEVDAFLRKIGFPVTVGYGMTECAPLISYAQWDSSKAGTCGRIVDRMECRIDSNDAAHVAGELWVKGDNVMLGYYKNPEATAAVVRDGWLNTGDLCCMDADGFISIRGRSKNMILGPSGQNIYPEEIEQIINNLPMVSESLVVEEGGKLVALVHPDFDSITKSGLSTAEAIAKIEQVVLELNQTLPAYSRIAKVNIHHEEFEKTPKRSIKRYLYQH